jgi:hypothetical protein
MNSTISYIVNHAEDIIAILGGVVVTARIIVKLTPTPKDDSDLEKVVGILKHLGLHIDGSK